jgi:uncharacterized phage protein (TIGR01671 family)
MREIKFRAWDKNNKKMIFGPRNNEENSSWILALASAYDLELMQYTELKDKNGKEIYEGDIVEIFDIYPEKKRYKIEFGKFGFDSNHDRYLYQGFGLIPIIDNQLDDDNHSLIFGIYEDIKIIGNIYENLELLERNK